MTSATEKTLREKLIEALKPYIDVDPAIEPNEWGLAQRYNAGLALDALPACLAENTEEWSAAEVDLHKKLGWESAWHSRHEDELAHLIAVLREELIHG